jgi:glutaredoxin
MHTQVLGISVDSVPCLTAWADSLGGITYPLLSDFYPHGEVAQRYGVLREDGRSERAIFVIDKQGIVRYVDVHDIDDQPDNEELFRVLAELEPEAAAALAAQEPAPEPAPDADVVMYCTPWCYDCRKARSYFEEQGIEYVEVDVSRDREADKQIREWAGGYRITPTFNVKGTIIFDFDQDKLDAALGVSKQGGG